MHSGIGFYVVGVCYLLCSAAQIQGQRVSNQRRTRVRCGLRSFQCDSGECILEENLCDGEAHCRDGSDETEQACYDIICPAFIFRCSYGACINRRYTCNGVNDCIDGSDETLCGASHTTTSNPIIWGSVEPKPIPDRPVPPVGCLIPNDPVNGMYTIGGRPPDAYMTGDRVPPYSVLVTECDNGFETSPSDVMYSVCANGIWTPLPSKCSRFSQASNAGKPAQCHCYC